MFLSFFSCLHVVLPVASLLGEGIRQRPDGRARQRFYCDSCRPGVFFFHPSWFSLIFVWFVLEYLLLCFCSLSLHIPFYFVFLFLYLLLLMCSLLTLFYFPQVYSIFIYIWAYFCVSYSFFFLSFSACMCVLHIKPFFPLVDIHHTTAAPVDIQHTTAVSVPIFLPINREIGPSNYCCSHKKHDTKMLQCNAVL